MSGERQSRLAGDNPDSTAAPLKLELDDLLKSGDFVVEIAFAGEDHATIYCDCEAFEVALDDALTWHADFSVRVCRMQQLGDAFTRDAGGVA